MDQHVHFLLIGALSFITHAVCAQGGKSSLSVTFGNAPIDFKIGWYDIDNESFDNHDVEQMSFSAGLKFQHRVKDNLSFRVRTNYTTIDLYEYQDEDGLFSSAESRQTKLQAAPGFVFSISDKRVSIFGGFELPLYFHGKVKTEFLRKRQGTFNLRSSAVIPPGFTAGIAPLMGFAYHLTKRLFCEAEFSTMCLYGKTGGKTQNSENNYSTQDALKGIFFEPRVALGLGVRF